MTGLGLGMMVTSHCTGTAIIKIHTRPGPSICSAVCGQPRVSPARQHVSVFRVPAGSADSLPDRLGFKWSGARAGIRRVPVLHGPTFATFFARHMHDTHTQASFHDTQGSNMGRRHFPFWTPPVQLARVATRGGAGRLARPHAADSAALVRRVFCKGEKKGTESKGDGFVL